MRSFAAKIDDPVWDDFWYIAKMRLMQSLSSIMSPEMVPCASAMKASSAWSATTPMAALAFRSKLTSHLDSLHEGRCPAYLVRFDWGLPTLGMLAFCTVDAMIVSAGLSVALRSGVLLPATLLVKPAGSLL